MIDVSIIIVCMNNLRMLYPCLNSIKKQTTNVTYEVIVTAYLFSQENLNKLKNDFPWITIIESNEIRGFSENNNLALKVAKGKYSFILNDDTEMKMPVVDLLVETIESLPESVAVVSPVLISSNNQVQYCGRAPIRLKDFVFSQFNMFDEKRDKEYINKKGIFKSYNIIGAAFLIKTEIFRHFGFFDERYFFTPEDIALSTLLNKRGYECYVNSDVKLLHYEGMSGRSLSMIQTATRPAGGKGHVIMYSEDNKMLNFLLSMFLATTTFVQFLVHRIKGMSKTKPNADYILSIGDWNAVKAYLSNKTPKEIFIECYKKIKNDDLFN